MNDKTAIQIPSGELVSASTPVIIECASNNPANNRLELLTTSSAQIQSNKLTGVYFCNGKRPAGSTDAYKIFDASTMRIFTVANGKLVISNNDTDRLTKLRTRDWTNNVVIEPFCIPANTCYLTASAGTPAVLNVRFEGVGIDEIIAENKGKVTEGVYTLCGTQLRSTNDVEGLPAGLYIVGGAKVLVK